MSKKVKTYQFSKFTDSYLLYKKKTPKFLFWTILSFLFIIAGLIIWSAFVTRPHIVRATSIFTVQDRSVITVSSNANILSINFSEGDIVNQGDIIIIQETIETDLQVNQLNVMLEYYRVRMPLFDRLIDYIYENIETADDTFDRDNPIEFEFYIHLRTFIFERNNLTDEELLEMFKLQTINSFLTQRNNYQLEYNRLLAQLEALEDSREIFIIRANSSGIIHFSADLSVGMFLQAGMNIGSIYNDEEELIAETFLSVSDRPRINLNDRVNLAIFGLSQNEFGTLRGNVSFIDSNAIIIGDHQFFRAIITLESQSISSNSNTVDLFLGMQAEARIVHEETTFLRFFLERLGIMIRR